MIGKSSFNVALSRPTSDLASSWAMTKNIMHLLVVQWESGIGGTYCEFRRLSEASSENRRAIRCGILVARNVLNVKVASVKSRVKSRQFRADCAFDGRVVTRQRLLVPSCASTKNGDASGRRLSLKQAQIWRNPEYDNPKNNVKL